LGGWVESTKNLDQDGFCWIFDNANVSDNAIVSGNVIVFDNAIVSGNVIVYGNAYVSGNAEVSGNAKVYGNAYVYGTANVYGNAKVYGNAYVYGNAIVCGDAEVCGDAKVCGDLKIKNTDDILQIGPIGSRNGFLTICKSQNYIATGCFVGTIEEFIFKVEETHNCNKYGKQYKKVIDYIKEL
jgi:hypothetical protein